MLTLCMVVKDEIRNVESCLAPICHLCDEIIIVDTGSTDGTPELIRAKFNIDVLHRRLEERRCLTKADVRNLAFSRVRTDWILHIDADERVDPRSLLAFREHRHSSDVAGYFGLWRNHVGDEEPFDDYKCFIFRRNLKSRGLVHSNVQGDIREKASRAQWFPQMRVDHYPDSRQADLKTTLYKKRLICALQHEPHWHRYNWFLGYTQFQCGEWDSALSNLRLAFEAQSSFFPVERLNSAMVQAEILCATEQPRQALEILLRARTFWSVVREDFEVDINFRMKPWIDDAISLIRSGRWQDVRCYRYAR